MLRVFVLTLLIGVGLRDYVLQQHRCSNINNNKGKKIIMMEPTTTTTPTATQEERKPKGRSMFLQPTHGSIFVMAADIFMMGNSYTSANSLPTMIQDLFRNTGRDNITVVGNGGKSLDDGVSGSRNCSNDDKNGPTDSDPTVTQQPQPQPLESSSSSSTTITVDVQAPGGWKIYQHANQITSTTEATTRHSQMLNATTQFVILQDQSQVYV